MRTPDIEVYTSEVTRVPYLLINGRSYRVTSVDVQFNYSFDNHDKIEIVIKGEK